MYDCRRRKWVIRTSGVDTRANLSAPVAEAEVCAPDANLNFALGMHSLCRQRCVSRGYERRAPPRAGRAGEIVMIVIVSTLITVHAPARLRLSGRRSVSGGHVSCVQQELTMSSIQY